MKFNLIHSFLMLGAISLASCSDSETTKSELEGEKLQVVYTPEPVLCVEPDKNILCDVMPSMIGENDAIKTSVGYHGLGKDVRDKKSDSQTPFDNMGWQMFLAANWAAAETGKPASIGLTTSGPRVWDSWSGPDDIFGGGSPSCANSNNLKVFSLTAKSHAQFGIEGETLGTDILEATGQPLIDVNGNWIVFERRLNSVEQTYIQSNGLDTISGQKAFVEKGGKVYFTAGEDPKSGNAHTGNGAVGAIEMKSAWRIISDDEASQYYTSTALLDVPADMVFDSDEPICKEVLVGLVGMHIMQKNPVRGSLKADWVWASFEHVDNAPLSSDPADPTDWESYGKYADSVCPVDLTAQAGKSYSLYNADCESCGNNMPPEKGSDEKFFWQSTPPYAARYLNEDSYGTQVVQCAKEYYLTSALNTKWQAELTEIGSVFANYKLLSAQWGGNLEPLPGEFWRNAIPDFLANTTMETYIQTDTINIQDGKMKSGPSSCIGCHSFGTLAYKDGEKSYNADFSFLLSLAEDDAAITEE